MVSASDSNEKSVKDSTMKLSSVEAIAEFAEIHLQVLGAGAVVSSVDKCFCIANDPVEPLQMLTIWAEIFSLMGIVFR